MHDLHVTPTLDLTFRTFWAAMAVAILLVVPLTSPRVRSIALALVNSCVIASIVGKSNALIVAGALLVIWAMLWLSSRIPQAAISLGAGVLGLFILHKLPGWTASHGMQQVGDVMVAVGFSYVALRLVEVTRAIVEHRHPVPGLAGLINYLIPFHMLVAGPIQSYDDFAAQPAVPDPPTGRQSFVAIERIAIGLFKKFILAEFISTVLLTDFRAPWPYSFLELQLAYIWLFLDFSSYSDIAAGAGVLLGVATPENFNRPYLARNPIDFWERWHISLSQFIRRNIFLPIQLTLVRRSEGRLTLSAVIFAFFVSFSLCGLWHSLSWQWALWGIFQFAGLSVCTLYKTFLLKKLGRKRLNVYMANPYIHAVAVVLMFEFAAVGIFIATHSFGSPQP